MTGKWDWDKVGKQVGYMMQTYECWAKHRRNEQEPCWGTHRVSEDYPGMYTHYCHGHGHPEDGQKYMPDPHLKYEWTEEDGKAMRADHPHLYPEQEVPMKLSYAEARQMKELLSNVLVSRSDSTNCISHAERLEAYIDTLTTKPPIQCIMCGCVYTQGVDHTCIAVERIAHPDAIPSHIPNPHIGLGS